MLGIDAKFLHPRKEGREVHSQACGSTIGAADAPVPLENLEIFEGTGIVLRSFSSSMLSPLTALFATLAPVFGSCAALQLENLALRHQIGVVRCMLGSDCGSRTMGAR